MSARTEVVGDIVRGKKTATHKIKEAGVRKEYYKDAFPDVDDGVLERVEDIITHRAKGTPMHDAFEAAHAATEFETALWCMQNGINRIGEMAIDGPTTEDKEAIPSIMSAPEEILTNLIPEMREWAEKFAYIRDIVENYHFLFEEYDHIQADFMDAYNNGEIVPIPIPAQEPGDFALKPLDTSIYLHKERRYPSIVIIEPPRIQPKE